MIHRKMGANLRPVSAGGVILALTLVACCTQPALGQALATGAPARFLASCEIDLNGDKQADLVLSLETVRGQEVVALIRAGDSYKAFVLAVEDSDIRRQLGVRN